jgi:hypothetical protein
MNKDNMIEALHKSIDIYGIEIIINKSRLKAILSDFLPGENNKFERKFLIDVFELDEWHILFDTHDKGQEEHIRAVNVLLPLLMEKKYLGWTEERSVLLLECYTTAMGWTDIKFQKSKLNSKTQSKTSADSAMMDKDTVSLLNAKEIELNDSKRKLADQKNAIIKKIDEKLNNSKRRDNGWEILLFNYGLYNIGYEKLLSDLEDIVKKAKTPGHSKTLSKTISGNNNLLEQINGRIENRFDKIDDSCRAIVNKACEEFLCDLKEIEELDIHNKSIVQNGANVDIYYPKEQFTYDYTLALKDPNKIEVDKKLYRKDVMIMLDLYLKNKLRKLEENLELNRNNALTEIANEYKTKLESYSPIIKEIANDIRNLKKQCRVLKQEMNKAEKSK